MGGGTSIILQQLDAHIMEVMSLLQGSGDLDAERRYQEYKGALSQFFDETAGMDEGDPLTAAIRDRLQRFRQQVDMLKVKIDQHKAVFDQHNVVVPKAPRPSPLRPTTSLSPHLASGGVPIGGKNQSKLGAPSALLHASSMVPQRYPTRPVPPRS